MIIARITRAACALLIAVAPIANGENLMDVYELALLNDPLVREAEATRMASVEAKPQARSALLPQLNFSGTRSDDSSDGLSSFFDFITGQQEPNFQDSESDSTSFTLDLTQTLFRWDQWIGLKQAEKVVAQTGTGSKIVYEPLPQDDPMQRQPDIAQAREVLGWEPGITLDEGLPKTIAYFRNL